MYVITLLLISVFTSKTVIEAYEHSINVGTVLFSPKDLQKTHWTKTELGLIRARRYFQELLPPPNFIDTTNEEYIHTLLKYFKDTYATIKREAESPLSDSLMTTAFSDALGGYLKLWVLPISKLSFYGGTVSQDNIIKLYKFHNEIKRYMGTDGSGWRSPDKILLKSITLNVAPPRHITRSMRNPCQHLAYYEKTENGLSIPTPYIDWEDQTHTLFVPLRNQSLIPLDSPDHPNALFKYYDTAKNCIDASNNDDQVRFDEKFQSWLSKDVVPHLSDENIYLPLGSVLTLVNRSQTLADRVKDTYNTKIKTVKKNYVIFGVPIDLSSKKTWIIGLILFFEIAWCIPALIYLVCMRRKKQKENDVHTLLDAKRNKGKKPKSSKPSNSGIIQGFKLERRPRSERDLEFESHFIASDSRDSIPTDTRSYFGSNGFSGSAVSVIHETLPPPLKSSLKKIRSSHTAPIPQNVTIKQSKSNRTCTSGRRPCKCKICTPQQSATSHSTIPTELTQTVSSLKEMNEPSNSAMAAISNTTHVKSSSDLQRRNIPTVNIAEPEVPGDLATDCPCLACLEAEVGSEITVVNQESRPHEVCFDKNVEINIEDEKPLPAPAGSSHQATSKTEKRVKNIGLRLESGRPYLEIKIDKPQTEISVGIGGIFDPSRSAKRSKIPKRLPKPMAVQMAGTSPMRKESPGASAQQSKQKTKIPQLKKRPADDMDVKPRKPSGKRKDSKLNVTL